MSTELLGISPDCEIVSSRIVPFSRELVFKAWTDPDHLKIWWGPAGFTNTFHEFNLRPGGKWRFTMHGPEKGNYQNEVEFLKIEKPSLIAWKRISQPLFNIVATFEEVTANETKIVFKMIFSTAEECNKFIGFAAEKNEENFDRLEVELEKMKRNEELVKRQG